MLCLVLALLSLPSRYSYDLEEDKSHYPRLIEAIALKH